MALRGALGVLVGVAAFAWPETTLHSVAVLHGGYLLADRALAFAGGWLGRSWLLVLESLAGFVAGLLTPASVPLALTLVIQPGTGLLTLVRLVGAYRLASGPLLLGVALRRRRRRPVVRPA